jgi:hypothetical protein
MGTVPRLAAIAALVLAAAPAAAAQALKPEWSRPVGGTTRFVGVEEYGRCSVFVDNGVIQVVAPSGEVSWTWAFKKISKFINPRAVAVSHECDAIAFVGDASYKYVWIVDRTGATASIKFAATPADVQFDRREDAVSVTTFAGALFLYSRNGTLQGERQMQAKWASADVGKEPDSPPVPALIARSEDGSRLWVRGEDAIDCVNEQGTVLATIEAVRGYRGVKVSKDFGQVLIVTEQDLHPVSVERYAISAPCRP